MYSFAKECPKTIGVLIVERLIIEILIVERLVVE
jgi:hypothetical protein